MRKTGVQMHLERGVIGPSLKRAANMSALTFSIPRLKSRLRKMKCKERDSFAVKVGLNPDTLNRFMYGYITDPDWDMQKVWDALDK